MNFRFYSILMIFVFIISSSTLAQEMIYSNDKNDNAPGNEEILQSSHNPELVKGSSKISYKLDMGSSFSTSSMYGNSLSFYTAPQLKYKFTPKLNISAGVMLINTSISDYYTENRQKRNFNQAFVFSGFDYKATEKLRISGEILYGMNKSPYSLNNKTNSSDYFARFSAEYKINDSFSVGFQVINQNMGYSPYGNAFGRDPFGNYSNPFNPFNRY
jgi:hypothetical protein